MLRILAYVVAGGLSLATFARAAEDDDKSRASPPIGELPAPALPSVEKEPAQGDSADKAARAGRPENRWRYQFARGRWWYWAPDRRWSYFDGKRWVAYRGTGDFNTKKVDPALLHLEAKEGTLGNRKWARSNGQPAAGGGQAGVNGAAAAPGVGWTMSGTRGSMGGASSFSNPTPLPGGMGAGGTQTPAAGGAPRGR